MPAGDPQPGETWRNLLADGIVRIDAARDGHEPREVGFYFESDPMLRVWSRKLFLKYHEYVAAPEE